MRITQADAQKREAFMLKLFTADPKLSGPKANIALKKEFGSAMRMKRVYELREQAIEAKKNGGVTSAAREPKPGKGVTRAGRQLGDATAGNPFPAIIDIEPGEGDVLEHSLAKLRAAGFTNLTVEAHKDTWAVINTVS